MTVKTCLLYSYSSDSSLSLRQAQEAYKECSPQRADSKCLLIPLQHEQWLIAFSYGALVFVNVPEAGHAAHLDRLALSSASRAVRSLSGEANPSGFAKDNFLLAVEDNKWAVGFSSVTIPEFRTDWLIAIAQILAKSSALELLEGQVNAMLNASERFTKDLRKPSWPRISRQPLLEFLSQSLEARLGIVNKLSVLEEPAIAWESEEVSKLYRELFNQFDLAPRCDQIEKMLRIATDITTLHLELLDSRRAEILEIIIVALITIEIIQALAF